MKKITLFLIIVVLCVLALSGCSKKENVPGAAWADMETLIYSAKDGNKPAGTLAVNIVRVAETEFHFETINKHFTIKDRTTKGTFVKTEYKDINGAAILESEVLLDGFAMVASYRKQVTDEGILESSIIYGGKGVEKYTYIKDGAVQKEGSIKIKAKDGVIIDSTAIYTYFRFFDMDDVAYSSALQVVDASSGSVHKLNFAKQVAESIANIPLGENGEKITVDCIKAALGRTQTPIGAPIYVYYAKSSYELEGEGMNSSMRIPVRMIENNMTYTLSEIGIVK